MSETEFMMLHDICGEVRPESDWSADLAQASGEFLDSGPRVYAAQATTGGPVKIGTSRNVAKRLKDLQTYSPFPIVMRCVLPGDVSVEKAFHRQFASQRLHGEWFEPDGVLEAVEETRRLTEMAMSAIADTESELHALYVERALIGDLVKACCLSGWHLVEIAGSFDVPIEDVMDAYRRLLDRGEIPPQHEKRASRDRIDHVGFEKVDENAPLW